ncbi:MAG: hypothetical protein ACOX0M_01890 [Salinivirgaceae bacterium]|jgi:hypothetical protein
MSKSKFFISIIVLLFAMSCADNKQADEPENDISCPQRQEREKFIEAERVAFLTHELELSADEAKVFWPVFDSYTTQRNTLWKTQRQLYFKTRSDSTLSKELALETLDSLFIIQEQMLQNDKELMRNLLEILPAEKVLKLFHAERRFKRHLLKQIKKGKNN